MLSERDQIVGHDDPPLSGSVIQLGPESGPFLDYVVVEVEPGPMGTWAATIEPLRVAAERSEAHAVNAYVS